MYTAINMPFGLYEWLVMPMAFGISASPTNAQLSSALRALIEKFAMSTWMTSSSGLPHYKTA